METVSLDASLGRWPGPGRFEQWRGHGKGRDASIFPAHALATGGDTLFLVIPLHGSAAADN